MPHLCVWFLDAYVSGEIKFKSSQENPWLSLERWMGTFLFILLYIIRIAFNVSNKF